MVRAIVGTLIEVGLRKLSIEDFQKTLDSKRALFCNALLQKEVHSFYLSSATLAPQEDKWPGSSVGRAGD